MASAPCFQATFKGWMDIMYAAVDSRDVSLSLQCPLPLPLCIPPTLVYMKWSEIGLGAERGDHLAVWHYPPTWNSGQRALCWIFKLT